VAGFGIRGADSSGSLKDENYLHCRKDYSLFEIGISSLSNQNYTHNEVQSRVNSGNVATVQFRKVCFLIPCSEAYVVCFMAVKLRPKGGAYSEGV
jgi:hypothetical protein